jgi:hypothetical protein
MRTLTRARAEEIARQAHDGQIGADGRPYIEHVLRVARAVSSTTGESTLVAVALLHDTIEKGGVTFAELRAAGATEAVVSAVDALTQRPGEPDSSYLARCRNNPLARQVKRHDLLDKLSPAYLRRMPGPEASRVTRITHLRLVELDNGPSRLEGAGLAGQG